MPEIVQPFFFFLFRNRIICFMESLSAKLIIPFVIIILWFIWIIRNKLIFNIINPNQDKIYDLIFYCLV